MQILERKIDLNLRAEELWNYIATPANLDGLTPPNLGFRMLSETPERIFEGLLILYEIRIPLFGRRRWLTEIKHIREGASFVDEQRIGPYSFWYHYHEVEALAGGRARMTDRIIYALPFGSTGSLLGSVLVRRMLEDIFDYRARKLAELFP